MAYNNTVVLTGNLGGEVKLHHNEGKSFGTVSIATVDSYQDEAGNWVDRDTIWHDLIIFSPRMIAQMEDLRKGARVKITGSIAYRPFKHILEDGRRVNKKTASIVVGKVEQASLFKKN